MFSSQNQKESVCNATDFKDVKWIEQAQDGLKLFSTMKTELHVSVYKSRNFLNRQSA
jgi:hypothetical protein